MYWRCALCWFDVDFLNHSMQENLRGYTLPESIGIKKVFFICISSRKMKTTGKKIRCEEYFKLEKL